VEIMTQKNQTPKADWLNVVVTAKARSRIKAYLREEQLKNARIGREELERKIKNWKVEATIDEAVAYLCKYFKLKTGTELYALIATQKIEIGSLKEILNHWLSGAADEERRQAAAEQEAEKLRAAERKEAAPARSDALVIDEGINRIEYKLAKCCNPIKGDEVFGFITVGTGITIHRTDCPNARRLKENFPYRVIEARWRESVDGAFRVTIAIVAKSEPGIANQITEIVSRELHLNIRTMTLNSRGDGTALGTISVEVPSVGVVDTLIHSICRIKGVQRAYRI
jgi:GTP pyrophosphokinase